MTAASETILTLPEVAAFLKVHPNTVYRLARKGLIPAFKLGTDWRFERRAVEQWMRERQEPRPAPPPAPSLEDEVLHVVSWLVSQGFSLTVSADEVAVFVDRSSATLTRELDGLVRKGHLSREGRRFALTPDGILESRRRYGATRRPSSGHDSVVSFALRHTPR